MNSTRMYARIVGVLFLVQMIAAAVSHSVILSPILSGENFLAAISANAIQVKIAMLLDLVCGAAVASIAILLFPILKKYSERIAIWYVGTRMIGFVTLIFSGILLLSIYSISKQSLQVSMLESSYLQILGNSMLDMRGWTKNTGLIIYCLSAFMFYYLLFTSKLIPRFISVWGLIGIIILFIEMMLITFGDTVRMILMIPIGLNEVFLGIWLIVKGFNPTQINSHSENKY